MVLPALSISVRKAPSWDLGLLCQVNPREDENLEVRASGKDQAMRVASVHPILSTCQLETASSPFCGFVALADLFGYSRKKKPTGVEGQEETDTPDIISKELHAGPNPLLIPQASPNLLFVSADSIEGRPTLHQYFKLFHETYVEYAHKVYFELKYHGPHLKKIIDEQHACLRGALQKLLKVVEKQPNLEESIDSAIEQHNLLEELVKRLKNLPGAQNMPLSKVEREFKQKLGNGFVWLILLYVIHFTLSSLYLLALD
ncbi:hypothetical protein RJ641_005674 [Dillenia turbinata]|uniref:Uncharacterized protein n=1 Tax=Dillenia turbinata TaxID=194707 RepID=A0AAN8V9T9_9MAGN